MALKKGMFENYVKERESPKVTENQTELDSKYSHNRVFDEPPSLTNAIHSNNIVIEHDKIINEYLLPDNDIKANANQALPKELEIGSQHKPNTNLIRNQTSGKVRESSSQTRDKLEQNWEQTGSKLGAKWEQTGSKVGANWEQTGGQSGSTIGSKVEANWEQTGSKVGAKTTFSELIGLQRNIIIFICYECKNSRSKTTDPLTLEHISASIKCNNGAVKNAIKRLEKKGCLVRVSFKNGRGGWSRYEVPDDIYHDVSRMETGSKVGANWEQSGSKLGAKVGAKLGASAPSSSSLKTTTTELCKNYSFDISEYSKFGFTLSHLMQLSKIEGLSSEAIEQSLMEFNFDYMNNTLPPIRSSKINFLMGLFRAGSVYVSEGHRNEQQSIISEMARRSRVKRESLLEEEFEAWTACIDIEQKEKIEKYIPTHLIVLFRTVGTSHPDVKKWLKDYYLQSIANGVN